MSPGRPYEIWLLRILVIFLPVQFGYHFWPEWSHIFGIRVDYFAPTIFLTDILAFLFVIVFALRSREVVHRFFLLHSRMIFIILVFSLINILVSQSGFVSFFKWLKVYELLAFGLAVSKIKINSYRDILLPLVISTIVFVTIGVLQFLNNHSLGGIFYFFGERYLSTDLPGVALTEILGGVNLRAYSTFSHPNSFAGFILISMILIFYLWPKGEFKIFKKVLLSILFLGILLTNSLAAYLVLISIFVIQFVLNRKPKLRREIAFSIFVFTIIASMLSPLLSKSVIPRVNLEEISERLWLNAAAGQMFHNKPIFGVGLNGFILDLPNTNIPSKVLWNLQPVHNIFLLVLTELGPLGLVLFVGLLFAALSRDWRVLPILAVILTGMVDHYWLTLQQNQLLLALLLGLTFNKSAV